MWAKCFWSGNFWSGDFWAPQAVAPVPPASDGTNDFIYTGHGAQIRAARGIVRA